MALDSNISTDAWRDTKLEIAERVADLIARMTPREKIAQLYGVWLQVDANGAVAPRQDQQVDNSLNWEEIVGYGVGQVTRAYGSTPVEPLLGARHLADLQRQIIGANRFGLPALVHEECLTGLAAWQATVYPSPLSWGASFDPDLIAAMGEQIGQTMRRLGVHQGLAPVLDVVRDLRWGRVEETIGEDPYLVGTIGSAYVSGLETAGIVATLKHFVGYSAGRAGRNLAPVSIGPRELANVLLPPFEMALRAGARSVMNNYCDLDGVPVAANPELLTERLRGLYGFTGTVVSDYFAVAFLHDLHSVAGGRGEAAAAALAAGIDVELPAVNCYGEPLVQAIERGEIDMALVDRALRRVLAQKCELGLLDPDWSADPEALAGGPVTLDQPACRALARQVAERGIVLLRNAPAPTGGPDAAPVLPLAPGTRVAVIGPNADTSSAMLGCYSFPRHVLLHHPDLPAGIEIPTLLEALRDDPAGYELSYAQGCPVVGGDDAGIAEAARVAAEADVCVLALGDLAGLFGNGTSGEGCDATDLRLPGRQEELIEAILATGTPVVLVLFVGRPYELFRQVDEVAGIVCAFFPGEEGAAAVANVLAGRVNPSGRLPVSFPGPGSSQPATYLTAPLGQRSDVSTVDPTALFPFGHGLSYAPVTWLDARIESAVESSAAQWPTDGCCEVSVRLRNDTTRDTTEVVQVYLHDPVAQVARPVQQLIAAARVDLAAGEQRTVRFGLHADLTSYAGRDGQRRVESGEVELRIGASSADIRATLPATLVGLDRIVGFDRVMHARTTLTTTDGE